MMKEKDDEGNDINVCKCGSTDFIRKLLGDEYYLVCRACGRTEIDD